MKYGLQVYLLFWFSVSKQLQQIYIFKQMIQSADAGIGLEGMV